MTGHTGTEVRSSTAPRTAWTDRPLSNGALVHEWVARRGGSELVLDAMAAALPGIDLHCLWSDAPGRYPGRTVHESWLARTPLRRSKAAALPFLPVTWRHRPGRYDWALVSSHLFAHHVHFAGQADGFRKYVYVHSPARYLWEPDLDPRGANPLIRTAAVPLRQLDRRRAQEAYALACNSAFVAERVRRCWDRDAAVIHPPVDVARVRSLLSGATKTPTGESVAPAALREDEADLLARLGDGYLLGASRFVEYKRLDLVIATGERLDIPVVLAGAGPERARLARLAAAACVPVHLVENPSDALLYSVYDRALALVFPGIEDFGILPVEVLATGTPVVVGPYGGAREIVEPLFPQAVAASMQPSDLAAAVRAVADLEPALCAARADDFSLATFHRQLCAWLRPDIVR